LSKKLYVGNLPYETTEQEIRDMISEYGTIESLAMINDRDSGRFRGFCFVEMEDSAANAVINGLNGKDIDGRALKVNEAQPREERGGGGNRGGGNWGNNNNKRGGRNDKFSNSGGRR
jgi:RNA recognition motif-containing protein